MAERCTFLKEVPLLKGLSNVEVSKLSGAMSETSYVRGEKIISQGERGDTFFVIHSGTAKAAKQSRGKLIDIGKLRKGDFFGESALLHDSKRECNIIATGAGCSVLCLQRKDFHALLGGDQLQKAMEQTSQERHKQGEAKVHQLVGDLDTQRYGRSASGSGANTGACPRTDCTGCLL